MFVSLVASMLKRLSLDWVIWVDGEGPRAAMAVCGDGWSQAKLFGDDKLDIRNHSGYASRIREPKGELIGLIRSRPCRPAC